MLGVVRPEHDGGCSTIRGISAGKTSRKDRLADQVLEVRKEAGNRGLPKWRSYQRLRCLLWSEGADPSVHGNEGAEAPSPKLFKEVR